MQQQSEAELIAQSLAGDTTAYGQLVDRYKQAIYYHCFAIVRDEDAAEDTAQETFIAAFYALKSYKAQYRLSTWLFKIATNKCLNQLRKQAKTIAADDELLATIASAAPSPQQHAEAVELHEAVQRLAPKYRAVISLHYWQGMAYQDIAVALDAPVNSVRVWLLRAKQQLRKELS
ncbi:MAG TPA: sigma-70 family RNA polymerase sigma factor [Candidatus Saccharimonadales bacterium]|nr:sigma-70 family RNA polymerase sigma factor [Candidatus Saccharimonadales bacterium]